MIGEGATFVAALLAIIALVVQYDRSLPRISRHLPGIVVLYFAVMALSTVGLWDAKTEAIKAVTADLKRQFLPAMIFLMLLRCDLRRILGLGPRMLVGFFAATLTICVGFIATYGLLKNHYPPDTWKTFAALCGSWIGGTGNMVAVQQALGVPDDRMGYTLLMDSINYAVWVMLLLALVPYAPWFNRWTGADTSAIDSVGTRLGAADAGGDTPATTLGLGELSLLLALALVAAAAANHLGGRCPASAFMNANTWAVLIATGFGIAGALTPIGRVGGIPTLASLTLYLIVALVGSSANFTRLSEAPLYVGSGFLILAIHGVLLALLARAFRLDLFTCGVASLANIGGVASAPILAGAYRDVLVPVGVLMGLLGYVVGTGAGLVVARIMSWM